MNKTKRELIDESSKLSTSRWSFITCITWGIILSVIAILSFVICSICGKPLPDGFLGGCALIISMIVAIPTAGKTAQSFSELKNHYFDKYKTDESALDINENKDGK